MSSLRNGFKHTSAVVTGASSGIGRAIAVALASAGVDRMVVHYRQNLEGAQQTVKQLHALGCKADSIQSDLSKEADRVGLIDGAFEQLGSIQTWINNAGADVLTGQAAELDFETKLSRLLEIDVYGTVWLSRRVCERLMAQSSDPPPSMVFLGWDQAMDGMEGEAGQMFGPTKAAVMAFAASLAQTVAPKVRVNTVAPGWIQTAWGEHASSYWNRRAQIQALMNRWGKPEDVAQAVLYACNPSHTFVTGQTLYVNGGWNRWTGES